jgi:cellulose synthase/poly-beta-1,6-N-acetylglucosamine synthase-like glycosyltransferase
VRPSGVSLVICTHNGESRLPATLGHIAAQQVPDAIPWEVVLVDNASTDRTADIATDCWPADAPASLRVIREPEPGLSSARLCGIAASRFEYVSFLDDDNWPAADWVRTAFALLQREGQVGAAGSHNEPVFEGTAPEWFAEAGHFFAVGKQGEAGDVTDTRGLLWGAGLTLRYTAWRQLDDRGFRFASSGRTGAALTSGEDAELCLALRVAGWRLWYEPALRLRHVMPPQRLTWEKLLATVRASGQATVHHDAFYLRLMAERRTDSMRMLRWSWPWQAGSAALAALRAGIREKRAAVPADRRAAEIDRVAALGRLSALIRHRADYARSMRAILRAPAIASPARA